MASIPNRAILPETSLFAILDTNSAGRAAFGTTPLQNGAHLLITSTDLSPISHVILRIYWKEVCAWCFAYDRGREWKIRHNNYACAFCSTNCEERWYKYNDETCRVALVSAETHVKSKLRRKGIVDGDVSSLLGIENLGDPSQLMKVWQTVQNRGLSIHAARKAKTPSKPQKLLIQKATELCPDVDILQYVLSGVLAAYRSYLRLDRPSSPTAEMLIPSLFDLMADNQVFVHNTMTPSPLHDYTSSYLVLLALLPMEMLDVLSTELVINLASRASHNAFSIRPEGVTDGEQSGEFLGWGVWPEASFFNHSCQPNIHKHRKGRQWHFSVQISDSDTLERESQLCITYLGGDEKDLSVEERRKRLQEQWGFLCQCERCSRESAD